MANDSEAGEVGARYASALFELAKDGGQLGPVAADLKSLKGMLAESRELRGLLASPIYDSAVKGRALAALGERAELAPMTRKFLGVLSGQRRASALRAVIAAFERLEADYRGVVAAEVTTAVALTAPQERGLAAALRQALGKEPEIEARVDPAILGGVKVKVGSRLYDASLKSRLDSLTSALKRA
ncbi:MAG TPA: F0F1 ATP synthase subunit delta [Caulobacteraceae bacterium]|nr:F0F1 ATP synthase subunit delta [Caulobacteraceae bacterium]